MTDYTELVKALRCGEYKPECGSSDCPYWSGLGCMDGQLMEDAAAAIEALQKTLKAVQANSGINFRMWEEAQAEVERLLAQLPKRGEWIVREVDSPGEMHPVTFRCMCSTCRNEYIFPRIPQYCPDCGSMNTEKMGGAGMSVELKRCPHCGAELLWEQDEHGLYVAMDYDSDPHKPHVLTCPTPTRWA